MALRNSLLALERSTRLLRGVVPSVPQRNFWGSRWGSRWDPFTDMRSIVRDMERQFDLINRNLLGPSFTSVFPKALPVSATDPAGQKYLLNIDLTGFKPEDVKVTLNDRNLQINAKMEHVGNDGSRFYQEVTREFLLPDNLDLKALKSVLSNDGILSIEAPLPEGEKPREIPIQSGTGQVTEQQQIEAARELGKNEQASS